MAPYDKMLYYFENRQIPYVSELKSVKKQKTWWPIPSDPNPHAV